MKKFSLLLLLIAILTGTHTLAQRRLSMTLNYSVSVPTSGFADFIEKTSFRGWNAKLLYRINEPISVGATVGFQDFYEKNERAVYKDEDGYDISAVVSNSIQTIPVLATFQYKMPGVSVIQPFVALGVGANFILHSQYLGQFSNDDTKIGFAARPELGFFIPFRKESDAGVNVSGAFNFMPYKQNNLDNLHNIGINVGAKFPLR